MPKHGSIILYVHGKEKARLDGQLRTATSTLTQLLNYDRGMCMTPDYIPEGMGTMLHTLIRACA